MDFATPNKVHGKTGPWCCRLQSPHVVAGWNRAHSFPDAVVRVGDAGNIRLVESN